MSRKLCRLLRRGVGGGGPPPSGAPVLTGPLEVLDPSGEALYQGDIARRDYWMLSANGTTPDAEDIAAGTGALNGAYGYYDAPLGSVQADITLPAGIDETGAVLSIVGRVEPDGAWSNILRDTAVDVQTGDLTATYLDFETTASPNFGALGRGWYLVVVYQRNGTLTGLTPPLQATITTPLVDVVPAVASGNKPMRAYAVFLEEPRNGAWSIGNSGGTSWGAALYSLSSEPELVASATDSGNNTAKTYDFNLAVQAGDLLFGMMNGQTNPLGTESATDVVAEDFTGNIASSHTIRASSGVAGSTGTLDVYNDSTGNFTSTSAMAFALRRAA